VGLLNRRRDIAPGDAAELDDVRAELVRIRLELDRASKSLDNLPVGVVLVDANGATVRRNARSHQPTGHAEVLVQEAVDRHVQAALRGRESQSSVELFGPPLVVIQVTATPLSEGGAIVAIEDITTRARLDAVRTDFVANISHELKTPVGALAVLAEAIADEDDIEIVQRLSGKMVDEAHRAATVIDDLLELSRIELGGKAVRDPVDVGKLMRDAAVRTLAAAEQRDIRLDLVEPPEALTVLGDRRQLVSALGNLIDNAVKYSEPGSEVWVSALVEQDMVALKVVDKGIGIPARDIDRIFERFYRVDRARSRGTGGTGLGLAIVRHVATNHEGEVLVQSSEGEGSTFRLRIPVAT
jgi:two-component system, OmpR family, sensor histidine kinase SenX3